MLLLYQPRISCAVLLGVGFESPEQSLVWKHFQRDGRGVRQKQSMLHERAHICLFGQETGSLAQTTFAAAKFATAPSTSDVCYPTSKYQPAYIT
jgi:hypothetical protein